MKNTVKKSHLPKLKTYQQSYFFFVKKKHPTNKMHKRETPFKSEVKTRQIFDFWKKGTIVKTEVEFVLHCEFFRIMCHFKMTFIVVYDKLPSN